MKTLHFLYNTSLGRLILKPLVARPFSAAAGRLMDSSLSRHFINPFIKRTGIDLSDYEAVDFNTFNDFFTRQIRSGRRPIDQTPQALIAPCDGLLTVHHIQGEKVVPVKQSQYTISALLGDPFLADRFNDGLCLVFRLCVDNYHRYCYFDSGTKGGNVFIKGALHTVRPVALAARPVFVENTREYTLLDTENFGPAVQMEVGALMVGRINNYKEEGAFVRGEEKGMFLYGGSTVILLLQKGAALMDKRILEASKNGGETPVRMGQAIGRRSRP